MCNAQVDSPGSGESGEEKISTGTSANQLKRFELGMNFMAGYGFARGFMFLINFNQGLTNISNSSLDGNSFGDGSVKNNYVTVKSGMQPTPVKISSLDTEF